MLSVGSLTPQKNFKYLIYEISNFLESNKNYDLYIIGEGEQKKELQNLINKKKLNDRVYLIDYTANVYSYMKNASICATLRIVVCTDVFNVVPNF